MKKIMVIMAAAALLAACNFNMNGITVGNGKKVTCKGPVVEKTLDLTGFDAIVVNGSSDMELTQGETFKVLVKANEDVFQYLDYKVSGGKLVLETVDNVNIRAEEFNIYITLPTLKSLEVNGAADVDLKNGYKSSEALEVEVNGAGDFEFNSITVPTLSFELNGAGDIEADNIDVEELKVMVNGAGDIDLSGKAVKASFSVNGAGDIDARRLDCQDFTTSKSGLASIKTK